MKVFFQGVDMDGSVVKLYNGCCGWPSFAPDGRRVVFTANADTDRCLLYIMDVKQKDCIKAISKPGDKAKRPCWHPFLERIAFNVNNETLWEYDVRNEKKTLYISEEVRDGRRLLHPCYSGDGEYLLAASFQRGGPRRDEVLYRVGSGDTPFLEEITDFPHVCAGRVSSSPDDSHVVFAGHAGSFNQVKNRLWVKYPGRKSFPLEDGGDEESHGRCPSYSPDGRWIACVSARPYSDPQEDTLLSVWIISSDGKESYRLTDTTGGPTHMSWTPDQGQMAIAGKTGLYLVDLPPIFH